MHTKIIAPDSSNEEALGDLVERTRHGNLEAWKGLWLALEPRLERVARSWRVAGRLSRTAEGGSEVVLRVMERLCAHGFRRLATLSELLARRDGSFRAWLREVVRNAAISCVRGHPEYLGPGEGGAQRWVRHVPLPEVLEDEHARESEQREALHILARAPEVLEPAQHDALCRWLQDDDRDEPAGGGLDGGADGQRRLVRAAVKRLRRRFAVPVEGRPEGRPEGARDEDRPEEPVSRSGSARRTARRRGGR